MKFFSFFKRMKETPESQEMYYSLLKEAKLYHLIAAIGTILFYILGSFVSILILLGMACLAVTIITGVKILLLKKNKDNIFDEIKKNEEKIAEENRLAKMTPEERKAEEDRKAEEAKAAEEKRKEEEARKAEEAKAEEARKAEEAVVEKVRKIEEAKKAKEERRKSLILDIERHASYADFARQEALDRGEDVGGFYSRYSTPGYYISKFLDCLDCNMLIDKDFHYYAKKTDERIYYYVKKTLEDFIKDYTKNDDGEIEKKERIFSVKDCFSVENNQFLKFVISFDCFYIESDVHGTLEDKINLLEIAFSLIVQSIELGKKNVLDDNPWLLDKKSYLNDFGTTKSVKNFIRYGLENQNDETYREILNSFLQD